jgi:hypothetical protein
MGLGIFFVSATDVGVSTGREGSTDEGVSTDVGVSTGREASTDEGDSTDVGVSTDVEGSTDEGDEVCVSGVSGVFKSGLSATRLSLLAVGADWGFCDFFIFFAAITESVGFIL